MRRRPEIDASAPKRVRRQAGASAASPPRPEPLGQPPHASRAAAPDPALDTLPTDALAAVLTAAQVDGGAAAMHDLAARLALVSRSAYDTIGETGAFPPIGHLVADAGLSFPNAGAYRLDDVLVAMPPQHRAMAVAQLSERLELIGPGHVRTLKFSAIVTACEQLAATEKGPALTRMAERLHLLPDDLATHDRVHQFITLLGHSAMLPPAAACALRVALANQAPAFSQANGRRLFAIGALAEAAATMSPEDETTILCRLVSATASIHDPAEANTMVETLFARCRHMPATHGKAILLGEFARQINGNDIGVLAMMDRLMAEAASLPPVAHARVLTQVVRMIGTVQPEQLGPALDLLATSAMTVPQHLLGEFHETVHALVMPTWAESIDALVADAGMRWIFKERNDIGARVAALPEPQRHEALLALVARFNDALPPSIRSHKLISIYLATQVQPPAVRATLMAPIAARLTLLKPSIVTMMASCIREDSRVLPDEAQRDVLQELAKVFAALPAQDQGPFGQAILAQAEELGTAELQAAALTAICDNAWRMEAAHDRAGLLNMLTQSVLTLPPSARMGALPALVAQCTRFNLQAGLDDQLAVLLDHALHAPAADAQRAAVLERLAGNLGECSAPMRNVTMRRLEEAARMAPDGLGSPVLVTLARVADAS